MGVAPSSNSGSGKKTSSEFKGMSFGHGNTGDTTTLNPERNKFIESLRNSSKFKCFLQTNIKSQCNSNTDPSSIKTCIEGIDLSKVDFQGSTCELKEDVQNENFDNVMTNMYESFLNSNITFEKKDLLYVLDSMNYK